METATLPAWTSGLALVLASLSGLAGAAALLGSWWSRRQGVKAHELEARRDELTAEDRLIGRLEQRLAAETARADRGEADAERWEARYRGADRYAERLRRRLWEANDRHPGEGWWPPPSRADEVNGSEGS